MEMRDYWYWLFCQGEQLSPAAVFRLLELFETPENIFREEELPVSDIAAQALRRGKAELDAALKERDAWAEKGMRWLHYGEEGYPERLLPLTDAPVGLYVRGKLPQEEKTVGIIGSRRCSSYGRAMAERFGGELGAKGFPVISGMALGIDGYAQAAALEAGGSSVGVLGCGADICYPASNRRLYELLEEKGGIVSEYPPGTPALSFHFPRRNRLISGLSDVLLVLEAGEKSGTLITVDCALEQGKEVMALPGRIDDVLSAGCNRLIKQGSALLSGVSDVLELLGSGPQRQRAPARESLRLSKEEEELWELIGSTPRHLEELSLATGKSFGELSLILLDLEEKGLVRAVSGSQYIRR